MSQHLLVLSESLYLCWSNLAFLLSFSVLALEVSIAIRRSCIYPVAFRCYYKSRRLLFVSYLHSCCHFSESLKVWISFSRTCIHPAYAKWQPVPTIAEGQTASFPDQITISDENITGEKVVTLILLDRRL
jgi:hypothetical protein